MNFTDFHPRLWSSHSERRAAIAHVAIVIVAALDAAQTLRCRLVEGGDFLPPRCGNRTIKHNEEPMICCTSI